MRSFWRLASRPVYIPFVDKADELYHSFSPAGRSLFVFFAVLLTVSSVGLISLLNHELRSPAPGYGGKVTEGILGSPRFINPLLSVSDADKDLAALVYSGLVKITPEGKYIPNLAERYEVSQDETVYTFTLREGLSFHDGAPVTAADVVFTVTKAKDPALKSPVRANWEGVTAEALDDHTVRFTLSQPYAPFIKNTALGVLPMHLWGSVSAEEFPFSDLNTAPVGTGPFKISSIERAPSGLLASYTLEAFTGYALGRPYLNEFVIHFYQNEAALLAALERDDVEAASGISPAALQRVPEENIIRSPLNRVFGVFFNQNESALLRMPEVRAALNEAVDREGLVAQVLQGYGTALTGPVPPGILTAAVASAHIHEGEASDPALTAREDLLSRGWEEGEDGILSKTTGSGKNEETVRLALSISTGNVPELRQAAEYVAEAWKRAGAEVEVKIFDQGDLSQNVIRPRKYEALLFGEVVGRELDLFAFWDSSQRNDPGLNIALYANTVADKLLKQMRETSSGEERERLYKEFLAELEADIPAVFLYAPDFVYSTSNDIKGLTLGFIENPSDRFLSVAQWHREVDYVWPLFAQN